MATEHPRMRLPIPCPACGEKTAVIITVLESTVRDGEETHVWDMDTTPAREHAEQHGPVTPPSGPAGVSRKRRWPWPS